MRLPLPALLLGLAAATPAAHAATYAVPLDYDSISDALVAIARAQDRAPIIEVDANALDSTGRPYHYGNWDGGQLMITDDVVIRGVSTPDPLLPAIKAYGSRVHVANAEIAGVWTLPVWVRDGEPVEVDFRAVVEFGQLTLDQVRLLPHEGAGVYVQDAALIMSEVTAEGFTGYPVIYGRAISDPTTLNVVASTFSNNDAGAVHLWRDGLPEALLFEAYFDQCTFNSNHAEAGGDIYADGVDAVQLKDSTVVGSRADLIGGSIFTTESFLEVLGYHDYVTFEDVQAPDGGVIAAVAPDSTRGHLSVTNFNVTNGRTSGEDGTGGVFRVVGQDASIYSGHVADTYAGTGALGWFQGGLLYMGGITLSQYATGGGGGALFFDGMSDVHLTEMAFCGGEVPDNAGSGVMQVVGGGTDLWLAASQVYNVNAPETPLFAVAGASTKLENVSVFSNVSRTIVDADSGLLRIIGSLLANGPQGVDASAEVTLEGGNNLWWDLLVDVDADSTALPASSDITGEDPLIWEGFWDGREACTSGPWPAFGSPLVDGGDPEQHDNFDGSVSDIGGYGGDWYWRDPLDQDQDGTYVGKDCDDLDATVHPGADDAEVDGVDQDCDGLDAGEPMGGDDTADDTDDSDLIDGPTGLAGGCAGCAGAPRPPAALAALLALLALVRRRR